MEEALRIYPGRALINSISLESEKIEKMFPIAKKYGAMFVLLPLSDEGLPKDAQDKKRIIETVYDRAMAMGMAHEDIVVDGLVATSVRTRMQQKSATIRSRIVRTSGFCRPSVVSPISPSAAGAYVRQHCLLNEWQSVRS